jgi:hypothetical protein
MVVVVLEWGKARMFTKENYINANDRLTSGWELTRGGDLCVSSGWNRSNECFDRGHEFRIQR